MHLVNVYISFTPSLHRIYEFQPFHPPQVQKLLSLGANVLAKNELQADDTALHLTARYQDWANTIQILDDLLLNLAKKEVPAEVGTDVRNRNLDTPLHVASYQEAVTTLLG